MQNTALTGEKLSESNRLISSVDYRKTQVNDAENVKFFKEEIDLSREH